MGVFVVLRAELLQAAHNIEARLYRSNIALVSCTELVARLRYRFFATNGDLTC